MVVAGVADFGAHRFDASHRSDPRGALQGAPLGAGLRLLLAHQPRSALAAAGVGYDLQLSGHTDGPITLEHRANEGVVSLSGGGSSFSLNCLQAHDFPELPADEGSGLTIPAEPLVEAINRVARAASRDETRPVLTGVLVRIAQDGLTMVATDSYRLAVRQAPLDDPPADARETRHQRGQDPSGSP